MSSIADIYNYRPVSPTLATSGQPREQQLAAIAGAGFEVVINLALHDDPRYSLSDEAATVQSLGMEYVHIPVLFAAPTRQNLDRFFEAMDANAERAVWVHCAANMRVSAFLGLYRAMRLGWPTPEAFTLMDSVWLPDAVWREFIDDQLRSSES